MEEMDKAQPPSTTISHIAHTRKRRRALYENGRSAWNPHGDLNAEPITYDDYTIELQVGEGTYGVVTKGRAPSGMKVALKRINMENEREGFPITAIREIKILKALDHPHVVPLMDVITTREALHLPGGLKKQRKECVVKRVGKEEKKLELDGKGIYMVFEYLDHDLAGLILNPDVKFSLGHIKYFMRCLFEALDYINDKCMIVHRDVKGSNILINNSGEVKLADFGLSRQLSPERRKYTSNVVTLWYRAPELLLGEQCYDAKIDIWAAGCLFAELSFEKPLFKNETEIAQLDAICKMLGTPTEESYPGLTKLCEKRKIELPAHTRGIDKKLQKLTNTNPRASDLLKKLLVFNPKHRLTAKQALAHPFFMVHPPPTKPSLDDIAPSHEFQAQKRDRAIREQERRREAARKARKKERGGGQEDDRGREHHRSSGRSREAALASSSTASSSKRHRATAAYQHGARREDAAAASSRRDYRSSSKTAPSDASSSRAKKNSQRAAPRSGGGGY